MNKRLLVGIMFLLLLLAGCDNVRSRMTEITSVFISTHGKGTSTSIATRTATEAESTPTPNRTSLPAGRSLFDAYLPYVARGSSPNVSATPTMVPVPTNTPKPTATPTPAWPETLASPGRSKLGLHVQNNNSPDIMEFIRRIKPRVVKGVDDLGFMEEVKKVSPQTITIGRFSDVPQNMDGDPKQAAVDLVNRYLARYRQFPGVDYWEGLNEPAVNGKMEWFATFEAERVRLMAQNGLRCAIGAFSTGVPEWDQFEAFLPAIQAAIEYHGIFTLHEYDAPTLSRSVGAGLPGRDAVADRGPLALRYRWWYEDFLKPRGLVLPLVMSEAGIDGSVGNRPGPKGLGWMDFVDFWRASGLDPDGVTEYLHQLAWYDAELQKDDYVIGCAIFTAGSSGDDWHTFDITGMLHPLAFYLASLR
jgi:hypothetical protein